MTNTEVELLPEPDFLLDGGSLRCYYGGTVAKLLAAERERCALLCEASAGMRGTGAWVALTAAADRIRGLIP